LNLGECIIIKRFEQKNGDSQDLQRFYIMVNLALAQLRGRMVMKNDLMYHPPMVKGGFRITELLKSPLTEENILTIDRSLKGSLGSAVFFEHRAKNILICEAFPSDTELPCDQFKKRRNHFLKNLCNGI